MKQQPESLRLADWLKDQYDPTHHQEMSAAELRRLHALNLEWQQKWARLESQRDELLESAKQMQAWVAVLLNHLDAELDSFEIELSNPRTGYSVTIRLKEHFDVASASIAKAEGEKK